MFHRQTLIGLRKVTPPRYDYDCPICHFVKMTQGMKANTVDASHLKPVELLHIYFAFWDVFSHHGLLALLMIIDSKTHMI
jgi:hypothetical protein